MAEIKEYKCPSCGGAMEFDSASQKMKCPYCDTVISIDEYEKMMSQNSSETAEDTTGWTEEERNGMVVYTCESCGGEITADQNTGATICPFCGNRVLIKGQFDDSLKPDCIIPFKLDKKAAKEAYHKHINSKSFVPSVFKDENHIDEIVGVYVPFWIYDMTGQGNNSYNAEMTRIWISGDREFTEHNFYLVERSGEAEFQHIPEDGSRKMADDLMESLEPYDFSETVPFKAAYLAGYVADRYDVEAKECRERAEIRVKNSIKAALRDTVSGYDIVTPGHENTDIANVRYKYALYPVWILNTTWQDKKYVFAMNGQSGKMVGDLPLDKKAFWKYIFTRGIPIAIIAYVILMFLHY